MGQVVESVYIDGQGISWPFGGDGKIAINQLQYVHQNTDCSGPATAVLAGVSYPPPGPYYTPPLVDPTTQGFDLVEVKSDGTTVDHGFFRPTVQPHDIWYASYWELFGTVFCSNQSQSPPGQTLGWTLSEFVPVSLPTVQLVKPYHYEMR
jgi:hypothetical protein